MSGVLGRLVYELDADDSKFGRALDTAEGQVKHLVSALESTGAATNTLGSGFGAIQRAASAAGGGVSSAFGGAKSAISEVGSVIGNVAKGFAIFGLATNGVQSLVSGISNIGSALLGTNASLEQTTAAFEQMLGSTSAASQLIGQLRQFANATPLEFGDLANNAKLMLAFGDAAKDVIPHLKAIGDAVSALGGGTNEINQVVRALGQMRAAGRVNAQDMNQLVSIGINGFQILADSMGKSVAEVRALSEKGLIPASEALPALYNGMEQLFGGGLARQAQTFNGLISSIHDNLTTAFQRISTPIFDEAKRGAQELLNFTSSAQFDAWIVDAQKKTAEWMTQFHDFAVTDGPALVTALENGAIAAGHIAEQIAKIPSTKEFKLVIDLVTNTSGGTGNSKTDQLSRIGLAIADGLTTAMKVSSDFGAVWHNVFAGTVTGDLSGFDRAADKMLLDMGLITQAEFDARHTTGQLSDALQGAIDKLQGNVAVYGPYLTALDQAVRKQLAYNKAAAGLGSTKAATDAVIAHGQALQLESVALAAQHQHWVEIEQDIAAAAENYGGVILATAQAAAVTRDLAGAYQASLQVQSTFSAQQSEYQGQISAITAGQKVLDDEFARGAITQDTYTQKSALYAAALPRLQGGVEDATLKVADFAAANSMLMVAQDTVTKGQPQLVQGTQEFTAAMHDAFIASHGTEEQWQALAQAGVQLGDPLIGVSQVMAGPDGLIVNIKEMVKQLQILNGTYVDPSVSLDTTQFDEASGQIIPTLDAIGQDTVAPTIKADTTVFDTSSGQVMAALDATSTYVATPKVDADAGLFVTKTGDIGTTLDGLDRRTAQVKIDADASSAIQAAEDALAAINKFTGGSAGPSGGSIGFVGGQGQSLEGASYTATIGAFIGPVLTNVGTATTAVQDFTGQKWEARVAADASGVYGPVQEASGAVHGLVDQAYTVVVTVDTSAVDNAVAYIAAQLPHSPADEGPLSVPPDWSYLTAGMGDDIGPGVAGGAGTAAAYLPVGSNPTQGPLAQPVDWSFIFAGIDRAADDAGKQLADSFTSTLGNLQDIASGAAGQKLQDELTNLIDLRRIAIETGAGDAVVAEFDRQITSKQAEIVAIGTVMGTDIVQGIKAQLDAADILQGIKAGVGQFSIGDIASGSALKDLQTQLHDLQLTAAAVADAGLPREVLDDVLSQIEAVAQEIALVTQLADTGAAAVVAADQQIAAAHQQSVDEWTNALGILSQADPFKAIADQLAKLNDLQNQVAVAALDPNVPPEVLASFQAAAQTAADEYSLMQESLTQALLAGLVSDTTLQAMATAGGEQFRAYYDGLFGAGALETLQQGWQQAAAIPLDQLEQILPALADHGAGLVKTLIEQVNDGKRSWADAWQAIAAIADQQWTDASGHIVRGSTQVEDALKQMIQQVSQDYAQAMLTGADNTDALAAELQLLNDALAQTQAEFDKNTDAAQQFYDALHNISKEAANSPLYNDQATPSSGGSGGGGQPVIGAGQAWIITGPTADALLYTAQAWNAQIHGQPIPPLPDEFKPPPPDPTLTDALSAVAGFSTTVDELDQIIKEQTPGGDLTKTFADEQVKLLSDIFSNPDQFPKALRDYVEAGLGDSLKALNIGPAAELEHINTLLKNSGLAPLTADQWAQMNATVQDALKDTSSDQITAIQQGSADIVAAIRGPHLSPLPGLGDATLRTGDLASVAASPSAADIAAAFMVQLDARPAPVVNLDGKPIGTFVAGHLYAQQRQVTTLVRPGTGSRA